MQTGNRIIRILAIVLGTVLIAFAIAAGVGGLLMRGMVEDAVSPDPRIVRFLEGVDTVNADIDIVFGPIMTGGQTVVVTDDAWIARNADALWFEKTGGAGPVVGAVILGLMGMPLEQFIATVYRDGVPVQRFGCLSVECINGLVTGMEGLDISALPGRPVQIVSEGFTDHDAYLRAHQTELNDPDSWFLRPGDQNPAPPDSGLRRITIVWPSELVALEPDFWPDVEDPEARARIDAWIDALTRGTGARIQTVDSVERMPLWLLKDDGFVYDDNGTVGLHDLSLRNFTIRLEVPEAEVPELETRYRANPPEPTEMAPLDPAIGRAFVRAGLDTDCLPGCGDVDRSRLVTTPDFRRGPDPFWSIAVWRAAPDGG